MFKSLTMLAGGAAGIYLAMATGAPSPQDLLPQLSGLGQQVSSLVPGGAGGSSSSCSDHWGSGSKGSARPEGPSTARVTGVRVGEHACFDRMVIDLGAGAKPGYQVRYVRSVDAPGSGHPIPLRGRAQLEVTVRDHAASGFSATGSELANVSGFRTFRQVAGAGSVEGYTEIGLGVRPGRPFRVRILDGPGRDSRLVIDVARHR